MSGRPRSPVEGRPRGRAWSDSSGVQHPAIPEQRVPFGFGLSYGGDFRYSDLQVIPTTATRRLVAFDKVSLRPGQSIRIRARIDDRSLAIRDTEHGTWKIAPGTYPLYAGSPFRALPLHRSLTLR